MAPKHCLLGFLISLFLTGVAETHPAHESLKPQRVHFQSRNFHNTLHWQPGRAGASNSSVYFVQYKTYGQRQWKNKEDCWGIQAFFCDLTNETSDVQEAYYGRVRTDSAGTHSGWTMTQRFTPWWETKIDPPVMNVTQVNGSLFVILRAPDLPYRNRNGRNMSMETYYELVYRVFIISNSLEKLSPNLSNSPDRTVQILEEEPDHWVKQSAALTWYPHGHLTCPFIQDSGEGGCVWEEILQPIYYCDQEQFTDCIRSRANQ